MKQFAILYINIYNKKSEKKAAKLRKLPDIDI